jgi:uncharacterized protein YecE (DUF72 family)
MLRCDKNLAANDPMNSIHDVFLFTEHDAGRIFIGCAGWSVSAAVQEFFPREGSHLERYAAVFPAVEINSSFYRPHRGATYARWRDSVPEAFRFAAKIPKAITHELRLRQAEVLLEKFIGEVDHLGPKLGCLLIQLPPRLAFDAATAQAFFAALRTLTGVALVCEPRHPSWFDAAAADLFARFDIAYVAADPPVAPLPKTPTVKTTYIRLHGSPEMYYSAYSNEYLQQLAGTIRIATDAGHRVWCVFDNTARGAAQPNALTLLEQLGLRDGRICSAGPRR